MEDTVAVLHLIVREVPRRYPNVRFIVPHLGGLLSLLLQRLDNQLPEAHPKMAEPPSATARRLWYDTVSHGSVAALRSARDAFGADRIVAGSDYPVLLQFEGYEPTFRYIADSGLPPDEVGMIFRQNAAGLLHLTPQ
jgi:aminocarboxymuconate-semialdehyde decarboxylase